MAWLSFISTSSSQFTQSVIVNERINGTSECPALVSFLLYFNTWIGRGSRSLPLMSFRSRFIVPIKFTDYSSSSLWSFAGQALVLFQILEMIHSWTLDKAKTRAGFDGNQYELVLNDDFNTQGRTFYPGVYLSFRFFMWNRVSSFFLLDLRATSLSLFFPIAIL